MNFQRTGSYKNQQQQQQQQHQHTPQQESLNLNFQSSNNQHSSHLHQQTQTHAATQQTPQLQQQTVRQQLQPLSVSQLTNLQANREAQMARSKLNSHKSFNLEDDMEFCPNGEGQPSPNSTYASLLQSSFTGQRNVSIRYSNNGMTKSSTPYQTPTKLNIAQQQQQQQQGQQQGQGLPAGLQRISTPNHFLSPVPNHAGAVQSPQAQRFHLSENVGGNVYGAPQTQGLLRRTDGSPIYTGNHQHQHQHQQRSSHRNW